jgi:hypothetical protein
MRCYWSSREEFRPQIRSTRVVYPELLGLTSLVSFGVRLRTGLRSETGENIVPLQTKYCATSQTLERVHLPTNILATQIIRNPGDVCQIPSDMQLDSIISYVRFILDFVAA